VEQSIDQMTIEMTSRDELMWMFSMMPDMMELWHGNTCVPWRLFLPQ